MTSQPDRLEPSPSPAGADPHTEPRYAFHRLMRRDRQYRWWRPLAVGGTTLGFYLALTVLIVIAMIAMMLASPTAWMDTGTGDPLAASEELALDMSNPSDFILTMLSLILLIPACFFAYLLLGPKPVGLLWSVTGRLRFRWLAVCLGAALGVYLLYFGGGLLLEKTGVLPSAPVPAQSVPDSPVLMVILVLLLVPFQALAEEYLFRGMLMQIIGAWLKHPLFAILLPLPLFVFGHLYDVYGLLDVAAFALAAGYLTWRTGGLEAAIGMHVVNNVLLFLMGAAGLMDMNATEGSLAALLPSLVLTAVLTFLLVRLADRFGVQRTAGPAPLPPQPEYLVPWSTGGHPHFPQYHQQQYPEQQYPVPGHPAQGNYPPGQAPHPGHPTGAYWAPPAEQLPPYPNPPQQGPGTAGQGTEDPPEQQPGS